MYENFCVQSASGFTPEGFGIAVWSPATNTVVNDTVYAPDNAKGLPAPELLGSPVCLGVLPVPLLLQLRGLVGHLPG